MARHTLVHRIQDHAERFASQPAIWGKAGSTWSSLTWAEYWEQVRRVAKGFIKMGVQVGDCIGIVGANRTEWVIAEFGMMAAGAIPAPIYTTNTEEQVAFILGHSRCTIAVCDDQTQLDKYLHCIEDEHVLVKKIVTFDDIAKGDDQLTLEALKALGDEESDEALDARLEALDENATALLIYTSGTTGLPKAVQLTHKGIGAIGDGLAETVDGIVDHTNYRALSYLPLCHVAEQLFTNFLHLSVGGEVYFCPDLKLLKDYLVDVRPTIFLGVPRVWEKFENALKAKFADATGIKKKLLGWSRRTEFAAFQKGVEQGKDVAGFGRKMANKIVLSKLKAALGLDELRVAVTGAAPINVSTLEFFASLGIAIVEGYGMSETTGVATASDIRRPVFGAVGKPLPGVQLRIAEDGEIQLKGEGMTSGYLHQPEQTAELFSEDGWLCTGDLGEVGDDGLLRIVGRKKDLIITAGGKNVAPIEIEALITSIPGVGQAVVVGDRQPYLCALIALDAEGLSGFAKQLGLSDDSLEKVAGDPKVREYLQVRIDEDCNKSLARYQTVKKFDILPTEFTVETGELTPTMKIKRNIVNEKFASNIDAMYA